MTPEEAHHLLAHALDLGLSASIETAEMEGTMTVRVCLTAGALLTLSADTSAVRYLLTHVAEIAE